MGHSLPLRHCVCFLLQEILRLTYPILSRIILFHLKKNSFIHCSDKIIALLMFGAKTKEDLYDKIDEWRDACSWGAHLQVWVQVCVRSWCVASWESESVVSVCVSRLVCGRVHALKGPESGSYLEMYKQQHILRSVNLDHLVSLTWEMLTPSGLGNLEVSCLGVPYLFLLIVY